MDQNGSLGPRSRVVIVGGSLAGLMHGLMLKRMGHDVQILEQHPSVTRDSEAAGISLLPAAAQFFKEYDLVTGPRSIKCRTMQNLDKNAQAVGARRTNLELTSWTMLYYRLRANFDGLQSSHCPQVPPTQPQDGVANYRQGRRVTSVKSTGKGVKVLWQDDESQERGTVEADLVIAADGSNSTVRAEILPKHERPLLGFVAWRGVVLERKVSEASRKIFGEGVSLTQMHRSYIILYPIPGENGSMKPGNRYLNFVWYTNLPEGTKDFAEAMTDVNGHRHRSTLSPGQMRPEIWAKQKIIGRAMLPAPFQELIEKIEAPFLTAVRESVSPQAVFHDGHLILTGDALALFRPNGGASTTQAAFNCLRLRDVLDGKINLQDWNRDVLSFARLTQMRAATWSTYYLSSMPSYLYAEASYKIADAAQRYFKL